MKVSLCKCKSYEQAMVDEAIKRAVDLVGGMDRFVKTGDKVVLKANLVMKCDVDKCATTHPSVIEAVGKLALKAGASKVIIADSAGGPFTESYMNSIYKATGMKDVAERCGFELNQDYKNYTVKMPEAKVGKQFLILNCLREADVIINVCKFKTHSFTGYTNALKNMFGAIPGLAKVEMHGQFKTLDVFGDFIIDINQYFKDKIKLHVTDDVMAMEGSGPSHGNPRFVGAVLASSDPTALDATCLRMINVEPNSMPFIQSAIERDLIDENCTVEVLGDEIKDFLIKDFDTVTPNNFKPLANLIPTCLQNTVHKLMTRRPFVRKSECRGCKKCYEHCPVKAITMVTQKNGKLKAKIDYNKCIRCYCCQELCPFGAVKVKSGLGHKVINIGSKKRMAE